MKNEATGGTPKKLHGNSAKVAPAKHVESLYQQNRVTQALCREDEVPAASDMDVEYARNFVDENKK